MPRGWGHGSHHPGLILRISQADFERVGDCWMNGRLLEDDLIMCLEHSGDCFYDYVLLDHGWLLNGGEFAGRPGYRLIMESRFGAYVLGVPFEYQATTKEFHQLMAGQDSTLGVQRLVPRSPKALDHRDNLERALDQRKDGRQHGINSGRVGEASG